MTNEGTSKYDSMQLSYNQRGWHGLDYAVTPDVEQVL